VADSRTHRGRDPRDDEAFAPAAIPYVRQAVADLSWLLGRGYAIPSALKLVGDRWSLTERQRMAVRRASCSDEARSTRLARQLAPDQMSGRPLLIDGFNLVTTVETALGGGVVLLCRDGTLRDLAGVHGTYRKVAETLPALALVGQCTALLGVPRVQWLFDRPVSNSGRIGAMVRDVAKQQGWDWTAELVDSPDRVLKAAGEPVATSDSAILDRCGPWLNLARLLVEARCPGAAVIDLQV
jgi:hypothetical protein